jgi:hypothetical protein
MGIVNMGVPQEITIELARLNKSTVFVETGTFRGGTTKWASKHFKSVHTIEQAESLYNLHSQELSQIQGVTPYLGDSRIILPKILQEVGDQRLVLWLDGHWSGGETAGQDDPCPLLGELACLAGRQHDIILIDDARLFLSAPPSPQKPGKWPTIVDVISVLQASGTPFVQIVDDVIIVVPNEDVLKNCLVEHAQTQSNLFWGKFKKRQRRNQFKYRLRNYLKEMMGAK